MLLVQIYLHVIGLSKFIPKLIDKQMLKSPRLVKHVFYLGSSFTSVVAKFTYVNKCYQELDNLAQEHNTAISQENQNDPPIPLKIIILKSQSTFQKLY